MDEQNTPKTPDTFEIPEQPNGAQPASTQPVSLPSNGFVCGLVSLILTVCCAGFGIVSPILAIISLVQHSKYLKAGGEKNSKETAGMIMAIIALVIYGLGLISSVIAGVAGGLGVISEIANGSYYV